MHAEEPQCLPIRTVDELMSWSPASDADTCFCAAYNAPLVLPPPPRPLPHTPGMSMATNSGVTTNSSATAAAAASPPAPAASSPAPGSQSKQSVARQLQFEAGAAISSANPASGSQATSPASSSSGLEVRPGAASPRLLVCHDMMGGYLQDRLVQGGPDASFYRLWSWDQIDIFIYFSHHMVTIPPPGWVHAAHRNGCQVNDKPPGCVRSVASVCQCQPPRCRPACMHASSMYDQRVPPTAQMHLRTPCMHSTGIMQPLLALTFDAFQAQSCALCRWLRCMQVLGTFITEWEEGGRRCRELFATRENAQVNTAVTQLCTTSHFVAAACCLAYKIPRD